jgi:hypothetical protein
MSNESKVVLEWRVDPDAEFVLQEIAGIDVDNVEITLDRIDWRESANNCARISAPLNDEKITDYHAAMARGDVFPKIVVEQSDNGFIILGGNQRANAVKRFEDSSIVLQAYKVDPLTSGDRELVIRSLNARHGWGSTKAERLEHAVYLAQAKGISTSVAARAMCVSEGAITEHIRINECRSELARRGVDLSGTPITSIAQISRVRNQARKVQLAKAVKDYSPTVEMVTNLVSGLEKSTSDAAAQKLVSNCSKEWAERQVAKPKKGKSNNKRKDNLFFKLEALSLFLETGNAGSAFSTFDDLGCNASRDGDKFLVLVAKINARLNCIKETIR